MRKFFLALGLLLLLACQPALGEALPAATPTLAPTPTSAAPSPTSTPQSAFAVTPETLRGLFIEIWHPWQGAAGRLFESQIGNFNATNPWGIQVRPRAFANLSELYAVLERSLGSVERPDVAVILPEHATRWAEAQQIVDLTPYLNDPLYGLTQAEIADVYPSLWAQDQIGTAHWGMPAQRSARVLLYNQDWAAELGFLQPPRTPDEFRAQACAAARSAGKGEGGWYLDTHPLTALSWIYALQGEIVEGQGYRFLTPANLAAFTFVKTLFDEGCAWRSEETPPIDAFAARQALFITVGVEEILQVERALALQSNRDRWQVMGFPAQDGARLVTYGNSYVLFKTTDANQLAAWLFVRWLLRPEAQAEMVKSTAFLPITRRGFEALRDYATEHPRWGEAVAQLDDARPAPNLASWRIVKWQLGDGFESVFRIGIPKGQIPTLLAELERAANHP